MELAATGRPVGAQEAKDWGLAYKVTTVEELDEATMKLELFKGGFHGRYFFFQFGFHLSLSFLR